MICFLGDSHAPRMLAEGARQRGIAVTSNPGKASLIFVSQDMPTDTNGKRDSEKISRLCMEARRYHAPVVLTSQVEPGFTRRMGLRFHQAETLRIQEALKRAKWPEMFIVGASEDLPQVYWDYLTAFGETPVLLMSLEEAEFAKIAINTFLAFQVDTTNRLASAAEKIGAKWERIAEVLRHDCRIGPFAYLEPGRWEDSPHLLRDAVTLWEIENGMGRRT